MNVTSARNSEAVANPTTTPRDPLTRRGGGESSDEEKEEEEEEEEEKEEEKEEGEADEDKDNDDDDNDDDDDDDDDDNDGDDDDGGDGSDDGGDDDDDDDDKDSFLVCMTCAPTRSSSSFGARQSFSLKHELRQSFSSFSRSVPGASGQAVTLSTQWYVTDGPCGARAQRSKSKEEERGNRRCAHGSQEKKTQQRATW